MPASMMRADTGATLNVIGSNMAIVASGPIPGSTPINVPRKTPMKQNHRFWSDSATLKPRTRLLKRSISVSLDQRVGKAQPVDEKADRAGREQYRNEGHFPELELGAGPRRSEDQGDHRRNEAG